MIGRLVTTVNIVTTKGTSIYSHWTKGVTIIEVKSGILSVINVTLRCQTYQCRCSLKIDHSACSYIVDTITELTEWSDFQKRDFVKVHLT